MPKKLITPATPQIIVPALNRRQILGGLGALALPIIGCGGSDDNGGPGGGSGSPGLPGGAGAGGAGAGGSGTPSTGGGGTFGVAGSTSPGAAGNASVAGSGSTVAGAPNGGSGNVAGSGITGGTSPGGAPGAGGTATGGSSGGGALAGNGAGGGGGGAVDFLPIPDWNNVTACTQSKTDGAGQGPFFIHEFEKDNDISMLRQDLRGQHNPQAEEGIELQIHLRFLTLGSCNTPIPDLEVYIWNTDAQGFYSGFGLDGTPTEQHPDDPYMGRPSSANLENTERFGRGYQVTNADGVVSFKTIYPGFYNGRDVHTHLVVLKKGSMARAMRGSYNGQNGQIFTTQFYYNEEFTAEEVHKKFEPYKRRTTNPAWAGAIKGDEAGSSGIKVQPTMEAGNIVRGQLQFVIDPTKSVGGTGG